MDDDEDVRGAFVKAMQSPDRRVQLEGLRDYLAHELGANRCKSCQSSMLRTGDQAALVLRLMKVLEDLEELADVGAEKTELDKLREGDDDGVVVGITEYKFGTKNAPRTRFTPTP